MNDFQKKWHGTLRSYLTGALLSLLLTAASYGLVFGHVLSGMTLMATLGALGLVQALVQLRFFLHVGQEPKPHFETLIFSFMVLVLLIIVLGSLWIMHNLDYRMMGHI